jgi:adenine C2-methylase RlmN of 23S rRNA A2503 and tRNA A37
VAELNLAELDRAQLEEALAARGHERFHARQIFGWVYRHGVVDPDQMTNLSRDLRATLASEFSIATPAVAERHRSTDGTGNFCVLPTGSRSNRFIPDTPAMTFCVSTQVGCAMACVQPDRQDGTGPESDRRRNRRAGRVLAQALNLPDSRSTSSSRAWASRCTTTTRR